MSPATRTRSGLRKIDAIRTLVRQDLRANFVPCRGMGRRPGRRPSHSPSEGRSPGTYIEGQAKHHRETTFQDEFRAICVKHGIEIGERYVWD